jgi:hypothetical protein
MQESRPTATSWNRLLFVSMAVFTFLSELACGKYRQHVYRDRLAGHYAAYFRDRKQPPTADTLELNDNGSCIHTYLKAGDKEHTEQSCTWTGVDKADGTWLRFEGLSDGIHRHCARACVIEAAAWDDDFVTRFEMPSAPDIVYVK